MSGKARSGGSGESPALGLYIARRLRGGRAGEQGGRRRAPYILEVKKVPHAASGPEYIINMYAKAAL